MLYYSRQAEYLNLSNQCIELSGQILSRVRDGRELDIILNEKYGSSSSYGHMARLNFAIQNGEKKVQLNIIDSVTQIGKHVKSSYSKTIYIVCISPCLSTSRITNLLKKNEAY